MYITIDYNSKIIYNDTVILYREVVYVNENNVQITSKGLRNSLKRYIPLKSICEYKWNGFDAKPRKQEETYLFRLVLIRLQENYKNAGEIIKQQKENLAKMPEEIKIGK